MPSNSFKRPPYCSYYIWFWLQPYHHSRQSFCASLQNFIQIGPPSAEKWRHADFKDGRSQPSWILGVQWVLWKVVYGFFEKPMYDFL